MIRVQTKSESYSLKAKLHAKLKNIKPADLIIKDSKVEVLDIEEESLSSSNLLQSVN